MGKWEKETVEKSFRFYLNNRTVTISAVSLQDAQTIFMERFGYWSEGENDAHSHTPEAESAEGRED